MPFFSSPTLALVAVILLNNVFLASAGHARFHRHVLAHRNTHYKVPRLVADPTVPRWAFRERDSTSTLDTQQLQTEIDSFAQWMTAWFASANATNSAPSVAQVQQEVRAHEASIKEWLDVAASDRASSASSSNIQQIQAESTALTQWVNAWAAFASATTSTSAISQLQQEIQAYEGWIYAWLHVASPSNNVTASSLSAAPSLSPSGASTTPFNVNAGVVLTQTASLRTVTTTLITTAFVTSTTTKVSTETVITTPLLSLSVVSDSATGDEFLQQPSSSTITAPIFSSIVISVASQSITQATLQSFSSIDTSLASQSTAQATLQFFSSAVSQSSSSTVPQPSSSASPPSSSGFNPDASNNVAVYFGQTPASVSVPLDQLCSNPNIDIVVVAFVNDFFSAGGEPSVNFGAAGGNAPSEAAAAVGATGLLSSPSLASKIETCQKQGKVILLSLGGALGTSTFTSDAQATTFAQQLWDLFGGGTGSADLRPFGSVKVDGFDIDNESHNPTGYTALTTALRSLFASDASKAYYISAAPQCPRPDASIPLDAMQAMDFVWVQFYNNGDCNVGQSSFLSSLQSWSSDLSAKGTGPRLFIGALASPGSGTGYLDAGAMESALGGAKGVNVANFGGAMLWDGSEAVVNGGYEAGVKTALL